MIIGHRKGMGFTPSIACTQVPIFKNSKSLFYKQYFKKPAKNERRPPQLYDLKWSPFWPVYCNGISVGIITMGTWVMCIDRIRNYLKLKKEGQKGYRKCTAFLPFFFQPMVSASFNAFFARGSCDNEVVLGIIGDLIYKSIICYKASLMRCV